MTRLLVLVLYAVSAFLPNTANAFAQSPDATHEQPVLAGYAGTLNVIANSERKEVTVVLSLRDSSVVKTGQVVFHIQCLTDVLPPSWKGGGRVIAGNSILAVIPDGHARGFLFKFPEAEKPSSLDGFNLDVYPAYGIARFGEQNPLTPGQIDGLSRDGRLSPVALQFSPYSTPFLKTALQGRLLRVQGGGCVAGGPGATSCSAGGCTVTCGSGYYPCCEGGTCTCMEKSKPNLD